MTAGLQNAIDIDDRVKLLMAVPYKDGRIYIRQIGQDMFLWDAVWGGQIYSSFFIVPPERDVADPELIKEMIGMCAAGAGATIDTCRGDKLSKEDERNVAIFESAREKVEGKKN